MARVLIIDEGERIADAEAALADAGYAIRSVSPALAGDVVDALDNVTVVAYLMGDAENPLVNDEMLETVLLKVVDTGVRGFVYERTGADANRHVEHAAATWHLSVSELAPGEYDRDKLVAAVNASIGI